MFISVLWLYPIDIKFLSFIYNLSYVQKPVFLETIKQRENKFYYRIPLRSSGGFYYKRSFTCCKPTVSIAPVARASSWVPGRCIRMRLNLVVLLHSAELHAASRVNDPDRCFLSRVPQPGTTARKLRSILALHLERLLMQNQNFALREAVLASNNYLSLSVD